MGRAANKSRSVWLPAPTDCNLPAAHPTALRAGSQDVARPVLVRAMSALGFELWTPMPRLLERIESAGVRGKWVGNGRPLPYPSPLPKVYDVVTLANNRWAELARNVVASLDPS